MHILEKSLFFYHQSYALNRPIFAGLMTVLYFQLYIILLSSFHCQSRPQSAWEDKYQVKGKPLSLTQIRNYGRQILEVHVLED